MMIALLQFYRRTLFFHFLVEVCVKNKQINHRTQYDREIYVAIWEVSK